MLRRFLFVVLVGLSTAFTASSARADSELKQAVQSLFDVGWPATFKTRTEADQQFNAIQSISRGDERAVYAYILVLIKQRRYPEAENLLTKLVEHDANNIHAWKAKAWLSMLMKEYDKSLIDLDQISRLIPELKESGKVKFDDVEFARFMGRMVGYLGGPADASVTKLELNKHTARLDARLDDKQAEAFESARLAVLEAHKTYVAELTQTEQQAEVAAEEEFEQRKEDLEAEAERLDSRRDSLGPEADKLREEMKDELKAIKDEDTPLLEQYNRLDAQAFEIRREYSNITSNAVALQSQAAGTKDPLTKNAIDQRVSDLVVLSDRYRRQLDALERQGAQITAQRAAVAKRYFDTQQRYNNSLAKLGAELESIEKLEKKNAYQAKRATKSGSVDLRKSRSLEAKAKALSTYEDFSLEAERLRVLSQF